MKRLLSLIAATAMTGCHPSAAESANDPVREERLEWRAAPEGSQYAIEEGEVYRTGYRCWPDDGRFDCLVVSFFSTAEVSLYEARRMQLASLPARPSDAGRVAPHYECSLSGDIVSLDFAEEKIVGTRSVLTSNVIRTMLGRKRPWDRDFVIRYFTENGLGDGRLSHFSCDTLSTTLRDGSFDTLFTTSIPRRILR